MKHFIVAALAFTAFSVMPAMAEEQTFKKPKVGGYRLDWCYKWATECGQKAADKYCQLKEFEGASDFKKASDIGDATPTKVLKTGQICDDESCDGFKYITCESEDNDDDDDSDSEPVFIKKIFDKPSLSGQRIHFCFKPGNGCGNKAADAFCDINGFDKAISFQQSTVLLGAKAPRFIGNGQICVGLECSGFKNITCRKQE